MKRHFLILTVLLSFCGASVAEVTSIDFDDFSGSEAHIDFSSLDSADFQGFRDQGLQARWLTDRGGIQVGNLSNFFSNIPGASRGDALASTAAGTVSGHLSFELDEPVRRFGLLISSGTETGWNLTGFDEQGRSIGVVENMMPNPLQAFFLGAEFSIPVRRIEIFENRRNGQNDTFDDIRFENFPSGECDFDGNKVCDAIDIDMILNNLGTNNASFDLNGSGNVDIVDRDLWLSVAGIKKIGHPFENGDTDLDGDIDSSDLNRVGLNWQSSQSRTHWFNADFDGSGRVDSNDLNVVAINWHFGVDVAAAVPEPSGALLVVAGVIGFAVSRAFTKTSSL